MKTWTFAFALAACLAAGACGQGAPLLQPEVAGAPLEAHQPDHVGARGAELARVAHTFEERFCAATLEQLPAATLTQMDATREPGGRG